MTTQTTNTRVIAMINQKGGVGKTTSTVNIGAALAESRSKTLLIDLDPQAHLSLHLGIDADQIDATSYDLLIDPDQSAASVIQNVDKNLDLIPSEVNLAAAEQELTQLPNPQQILSQKLAPIIDQYDYVLLDCPPSLGMLTINALATAAEIIVPMQAHFLALQGLSKLLATIQMVRDNLNPTLSVSGVILCQYDANTNLAKEVVDDLTRFFAAGRKENQPWSDALVYHPPIRRNIKLAECPSFGTTIFQYAPTSLGAQDYRALAKSIRTKRRRKSSKPRLAPMPPITIESSENLTSPSS